MDFGLSEEQELLQHSARDFLARDLRNGAGASVRLGVTSKVLKAGLRTRLLFVG